MTKVVINAKLNSIQKNCNRRDICEFQLRRRQQQRQRYELRILLVQQGKISVLHVRHAFYNNSVSSSVKQQLEITTFPVWG